MILIELFLCADYRDGIVQWYCQFISLVTQSLRCLIDFHS